MSDIQEKVKLGVSRTVIEQTILPYKDVIRDVIVKNVRKVEYRIITENNLQMVNFVTEVVEESINDLPQYKKLIKIPFIGERLKDFVNRKNINSTVEQLVNNFSNSLNNTLNKEVGESLLNSLVEDFIDEIIIILRDVAIQKLIEDINLQLLEELKKANRVKKWKMLRKSDN